MALRLESYLNACLEEDGRGVDRWVAFIVFVLLLISALAICFVMAVPFLVAVAMGFVLSVLARPVHARLRSKGFGQGVGAGVTTLGLLLLVIGPLLTFAVLAARQAVEFARKLSAAGSLSPGRLIDWFAHWGPARRLLGEPSEVERRVFEALRDFGARASTEILAWIGAVPEQLLQVALSLLTCFFLLADGSRARAWLASRLPGGAAWGRLLARAFEDTAVSVIWATLVTASVQALLMGTGYLALGVPLAFLAAGCTFILAWIPVIGSLPVWVAGVGYLQLVQSDGKRALAMLALGAVVGLIDNFIRPLVLRGRSAMHPLVSLLAILGGLRLFGLAGVFFGPIVVAVCLALIDAWPSLWEGFSNEVSRPGLRVEKLRSAPPGVGSGESRGKASDTPAKPGAGQV